MQKQMISSVRELNVYKKSFDVAVQIFQLTRSFPREEKYSLTDQMLRSSWSVCSNLPEAWRKRKYKAVFVNKLTDCAQEAAETQTWLEFALKCGYIDNGIFQDLDQEYEKIFAMLITMERKAESFCS